MRHIIIAPVIDDVGPVWAGGSPEEQGYKNIALPKLKRHEARNNEYYVYSNDTEFKSVLAESAVLAVAESQISDPKKVIHAHSRIADVMDSKKLEFIGLDVPVADIIHDIVAEASPAQEIKTEEQAAEVAPAPEAEKKE